jgi:hypothetical protein
MSSPTYAKRFGGQAGTREITDKAINIELIDRQPNGMSQILACPSA